MVRTRTSLRERGFQILGLGQSAQGNDALMDANGLPEVRRGSAAIPGGRQVSTLSSIHPPGNAGPSEDGTGLRHTWEIENLLGAEAEAAVGDQAAPKSDVAASEEPGTLPAVEWIAPISPPSSRPMAASPPTLPSTPLPAPATESPPPLPTRPPSSPPGEETATPRLTGAPDQDSNLLPMPRLGGAAENSMNLPRSVRLTDEQRAELSQHQDVQEKLVELSRAIQVEYDRILHDDVSTNKDITDWCHTLLAEARVIVMYRELGDLARAEWCVQQVRARLDRAEQSTQQIWVPVAITLWGVAWFISFISLIFDPLWVLGLLNLANFSDPFISPEVFLRALFFGGLGGVAAVFYHLFKYVRDRSFDGKYVLSYFGKPFMGMILGSMIYLTVFVAMRLLGLTPVGLPGSAPESVTNVLYMALLYFIAMAVGFKENLAFDLLSRVIKAVLRTEEASKSPAPVG
jgi:hypothetical protein